MTYPPGPLGVLMELYEAEVGEFLSYLRGLSREQRAASADFGGRVVTIEGILEHVVRAGVGYAQDARGAVQGEKRELAVAGDRLEQIHSMVRLMGEAVDGAWDKSEDELNVTMIDTSWGQRFSLDQLMEHAIVHVLWHRRQCGRVVQKARSQNPGS